MKANVKLVTQRELEERRLQAMESFMESRAMRYERTEGARVLWVGIVVYVSIATVMIGWCIYEGIGPVFHKIAQAMAAFDAGGR